jgi:hypothetical protein
VLTLRYLREHSIRDIGRFLGVPEGTVKSRLHAARKRMEIRLMDELSESLEAVAPDENFARKVADAMEVYRSPGPADGDTHSPWADRIRSEVDALAADPEGVEVAASLSKSPHAKVRLPLPRERPTVPFRTHSIRRRPSAGWRERRASWRMAPDTGTAIREVGRTAGRP